MSQPDAPGAPPTISQNQISAIAQNTGAQPKLGTKPENPAERCLQAMAETASQTKKLNIVPGSQRDSALTWQSVAIHPLQPLENVHQRMVRTAGRLEQDLSKRQKQEEKQLVKYFLFAAGEPQLINTPRDALRPEDQFPDERLSAAQQRLTAIVSELKRLTAVPAASNGDSGGPVAPSSTQEKENLEKVQKQLTEIVTELEAIRKTFPVPGQAVPVPILDNVDTFLGSLKTEIPAAPDLKTLKSTCKHRLTPTVQLLNRALAGVARVQMFYNIEPFYLFRLLVRFSLQSDQEISDDNIRAASSELTKILNNYNSAWLFAWLRDRIRELDSELKKLDPETELAKKKLIFYVKGGRALAYLEGKPESGENDWDTGIVINPYLPEDQWYATFNQVHDLVLRKLKEFKQRFFVLMHEHAGDFKTVPPPQPRDTVDEAREQPDTTIQERTEDRKALVNLVPKYVSNCKAELIDIGIPRRDTVEAFEQWNHTGRRMLADRAVPIPGHLYYTDEYVTMVREALAEVSPSISKTPKRIRRLFDILTMTREGQDDPGLVKAIADERAAIPASGFEAALGVIDGEGASKAVPRILTVLLKQFVHAYDLKGQSSLVAPFNTYFAQKSKQLAQLPAYPAKLQQGIAEDKKDFKDDTHGILLRWIHLTHYVSTRFEQHFRERAAFFGFGGGQVEQAARERRELLTSFVRTLYKEAPFSQADELEVQLAVTDSYAAYLYADYVKPRLFGSLKEEAEKQLDPVNIIEIKLFCRYADTDPATVKALFIQPGIDAFTQSQRQRLEQEAQKPEVNRRELPQLVVEDQGHTTVLVSWYKDVAIPLGREGVETLTYKPLVARISIVIGREWPQLAFIWGIPVVSLRDLIREYDMKSAEAEEFATTQRLRKTAALLKEMLTQYEAAPDPASAAVRPGQGSSNT